MTENVSNENLLNLKDKTAIVTGGSKGIGLGIVERLCAAGAKVVIADIDKSEAERVCERLGSSVVACETDVSDPVSVEKMVDLTMSQFGGIDILVNNAGIFPNVPVSSMSFDDFKKVIDINLGGVFSCTKFVSAAMIKSAKGGRIINITSIDALHPSMVGLAHYDASKHGVWGFTKNTALELSQFNITVNAIAPGGIFTPGVAAMSADASADSEDVTKAFLAGIPMKRFGDPDEIGKVALFLASDMSSYITGSQIVVDGGALLG